MQVSKLISITYNWYYTTNTGEHFEECTIGKDGVTNIQEGVLSGEPFYEVWYGDKIIKVLNANTVIYKVEISKKRT